MQDGKPLIVLTGPTAVGKTTLSLALARAVGGEIVSADSVQVYRGLDIGSAKIMPEEMEGIPHHLIDVLDPDEPFDVAHFQEMALEAMDTVYSRGHIPILTGGTGFYIQAVTRRIDFTESGGEGNLRRKWTELAEKEGPEALHALLAEADPDAAEAIHPHNIKRVIRALEFYEQTGSRISEHNEKQRERTSPYRLAYFVLTDDRARLYAQIDRRVDAMIAAGLESEVRHLLASGLTENMTSMKAIGYKEFFPYFRTPDTDADAGTFSACQFADKGTLLLSEALSETDRQEVIRQIKLNTRHYAKRQLTWFRREPDAVWIDKRDYDYDEGAILVFMLNVVNEKINNM